MKVLHVITTLNGGAGIACHRIHTALRKYGIDSEILSRDLSSVPQKNKFLEKCQGKIDYWLLKRFHHDTNPILHSTGLWGNNIVSQLNTSDADIIHLHWINLNFLSIRDIAKIQKPLVWTLHDTWAFCGTEHYPNILEQDKRYIEGYSNKNIPVTTLGIDTDQWIWKWKKFCWKKLKIYFITPSHWEAEALRQSMLLKKHPCTIIPNCLDTGLFKPLEKTALYKKFGLPENKKIILFGTQTQNNPLKGIQYLHSALNILVRKRNDLHLLTFGDTAPKEKTINVDTTNMGFIANPSELVELYNAADVFVCPSIIESFSNTTAEALSCGIPVVAFNRAGGVVDLIQHQQHGYLAVSYEIQDLANGIEWCLNAPKVVCDHARTYALQNFAEHVVAEAYHNLYKIVLRAEK